MAWTPVNVDGSSSAECRRYEFLLDSESDMSSPAVDLTKVAPGSVAYVPDLSAIWVFGADGEFHKVGG